MTSEAQWEMAAEILQKGEKHPAIKAVYDAYQEVVAQIDEAAVRSKNMKRIGVGRTEDPTLVVSHVVPALRELAETASLIAEQMEKRLER